MPTPIMSGCMGRGRTLEGHVGGKRQLMLPPAEECSWLTACSSCAFRIQRSFMWRHCYGVAAQTSPGPQGQSKLWAPQEHGQDVSRLHYSLRLFLPILPPFLSFPRCQPCTQTKALPLPVLPLPPSQCLLLEDQKTHSLILARQAWFSGPSL